MFEWNVGLIQNVLQEGLGAETEFFYDIHCPDPFEKKVEFSFPVVAVHATGLYIMFRPDGAKGQVDMGAEQLDYVCHVFKSYFRTRVSVRGLFLLIDSEQAGVCKKLAVYDSHKKELLFDCVRNADDLCCFLKEHSECRVVPPQDEIAELTSLLWDATATCLETGSEKPKCFVKRGSEWMPAFREDSDKAFRLALFGGFLGLHRFYLHLPLSGLLYMLTFGIFGVGWLFDVIEILLGCWRHKGVFLRPLQHKARHWIEFALVLIVIGGALYVSMARS